LQQLGLPAQVQALVGNDQNGTVFQKSVPPNTLVQAGTQITLAVFP
jgi:hypothetical protein